MSKLTFDEIADIVNKYRKEIRYDSKDWSIEMIMSKFERPTECERKTEIYIPFYQREFVWKEEQTSKLIETILLGLPIPAIYLEQTEDGIFEIIDGSQRIRAIHKFVKGNQKLKGLNIIKELNGLTFNDFPQNIKRKFNAETLRLIVIENKGEEDTIANEIFNRINTGGTKLTDMEVSKGSLSGDFLTFIYEECSKNEQFNNFAKFGKNAPLRGYPQEFIIKFFLFYDKYISNKQVEIETTLNSEIENFITKKNDEIKSDNTKKDDLKTIFKRTLDFINDNNLIDDEKYTTRKKEKLLSIMLAVSVFIIEHNSRTKQNSIWSDEFIENSKTNSIDNLNKNIKNILENL